MKLLNKIKVFLGIKVPVKIERGMRITRAAELKAIIAPISPENFIVGMFGDGGPINSCFIGHIHRAVSPIGPDDVSGNNNGYGARAVVERFLREKHKSDATAFEVNDYSYVNGYNEPEIKDRLTHLVNDMIRAGY